MFIRMTKALLCGIKNVATYIFDMCTYSNAFREHVLTMSQLFEWIQENELTIKPSKIDISFPEESFLGHAIKHTPSNMDM